jgi:two-component system chemotaxis response regulator CheY
MNTGYSLEERNPMQALIIDDSPVARKLIKNILSGMGFEVSEAGNGREGLVRLRGLES